MTKTEAAKLVAIAMAACPTPASFLEEANVEAMVLAWALVLRDIDYPKAEAALARYLCERDTAGRLPSPGHIRGIVDEAAHGRRRHGADAWGDVLRTIGAVGRYRDPTFDDAVTQRCVDRLGWRDLCDSENAIADRARFIELYDKLAVEATSDRAVASLPGVARPALPRNVADATGRRLTAGTADINH
jgi:hypothetical protein